MWRCLGKSDPAASRPGLRRMPKPLSAAWRTNCGEPTSWPLGMCRKVSERMLKNVKDMLMFFKDAGIPFRQAPRVQLSKHVKAIATVFLFG